MTILEALDDARVPYWVGGGWGVAALVGRQTRDHRDLDLAVSADHLQLCLDALGIVGYETETDWLPVRIELRAAAGDAWVDFHPVLFDARGHGRQAGLDGTFFDYPAEAFSAGVLNGRDVRCLSVGQQRAFNTGYRHQAKDTHDLAQLDGIDPRQ